MGNIPSAKPVPIHLSFLACWLFFLLGVWASEFNAILFVIPLAFIIHEPRKYFSKKNSPYFFHLLIALVVVISVFIYLKSVAPADDRYDKTFFFNMADIKKEWSFLIHKIRTTLLFDDHRVLENWYYYFLLLLSFSIYFMRKPVANARKMILVRSLFITGLISFIFLFFSVWNLVSEIGVRYYIPVYLMVMTGLLILADEYCRIFFKLFTFLLISFFSVYFTWLTLIRHNQPGPLERFGEFSKLPEGTLIASYWSAYLINGVACYNLQSLPFQDEYVRNWLWRDIPLAEKNIYFIEDPVNRSIPLTDTIVQFEKTFVYSGNSYDCNGIRVKQYHHLTP